MYSQVFNAKSWRGIWVACLMAALSVSTFAQPPGEGRKAGRGHHAEGSRHAEIIARKHQMIEEEIALQPEQSEAFWKLYKEYSEGKRDLRRQMHDLRKGMAAKSDAQLQQDMNALFDLMERAAQHERDYYGKFQEVLSVRQTTQLYMTEVRFKKKLLRELSRRGVKGVDADDY